MNNKIVIIGAGPSGILLALYLVNRVGYEIEIYEKRSDPRTFSGSRSKDYPIILCQRGFKALARVPNLAEFIKAGGVEVEGAISFSNCRKKFSSKKQKMLTITRKSLVLKLLEFLENNYDNNKIKINFGCSYLKSDFHHKYVVIQKNHQNRKDILKVGYDYLIGADGVHSLIREDSTRLGYFESEKLGTNLYYKTLFIESFEIPNKCFLTSGRVYGWRSTNGITVLASKQKDQSLSCTLFIRKNNLKSVKFFSTEDVLSFFEQNFNDLSQFISPRAAGEFLRSPLSQIFTVSCSAYHHNSGVLIVGDAAHAISPMIGQGCNCALEDILVFDSILEKFQDNWQLAMKEYSEVRVKDGHAIRELADNSLPMNQLMFALFLIRLTFARALHKLLPQFFSLPFFDLISDTTIAYSKIYNSAQTWIVRIKKSNERFLNNVENS